MQSIAIAHAPFDPSHGAPRVVVEALALPVAYSWSCQRFDVADSSMFWHCSVDVENFDYWLVK